MNRSAVHMLRVVAAAATLLMAATVNALTIGDVQLHSHLGEPLRATVAIENLGSLSAGELIVGSAPEADYRAMGIEKTFLASTLKYELDVAKGGRGTVEISTANPVGEPYVDIVLEIRWPGGRAVRQFTLLLDPRQ
jgi:pilus assembly protein FimV